MRVVVASGIWPPDIGGPASNAPDVASFLHARGHDVVALTAAEIAPATAPYPVRWVSRALPPGLRHARFAWEIARLARHADVIYTSSVVGRSVVGAAPSRTPLVVKLPDDPAFERARRRGLFRGNLDEFQHTRGIVLGTLRTARTAALRRADLVVCPSRYLRNLAVGWGVDPARVAVLPNPAPADVPPRAPRERAFVLAGRLTAQKAVAVAIDAVAQLDDATLTIVGDGPERPALEQRARDAGLDGRVRFTGAVGRDRVLEEFAAAAAVVSSSAWENFPHALVEALATGAPIVATRVGGVPEIVEDGVNGLLVDAGDPDALAAALIRFAGDATLRRRLEAAAAPSVERFDAVRIYTELERLLEQAAGT